MVDLSGVGALLSRPLAELDVVAHFDPARAVNFVAEGADTRRALADAEAYLKGTSQADATRATK
jgi:hypothetical protein